MNFYSENVTGAKDMNSVKAIFDILIAKVVFNLFLYECLWGQMCVYMV